MKPSKMADITTIRKSISKMSDEAIDQLIQERRANRRTVQAQPKKTSSRRKSSKKKKSTKSDKKAILDMFQAMSPEEREQLKNQIS